MLDSMKIKILMDRKIDPDVHYIMSGGYVLTSKGNNVTFDFTVSYGYVQDNPSEILFHSYDLDIDCFPESAQLLTKEFIESTEKIEECYIYTGEEDEEIIKPIKILEWSFCFGDKDIELAPDILESYSFT